MISEYTSKRKIAFINKTIRKEFTRLFPTKTTETKEVIAHLKNYFASYSRPKMIISDRGSSFTSDEFAQFLKENDIEHAKIATGSPKANGQVERINRIIGPMLGKLRDDKTGEYWYKIIEDVEYAINNTVCKTTGTTPAKLLFGVNQREKKVDEIKDMIVKMNVRDLEKQRTIAAEKIAKAQAHNKKHFDKGRKEAHRYVEGDYVMTKNFENTPGVSKKLIPKYKGPYKIIKVLRNDRYVISDVENFQLSQRPYSGVWEAANLRPWCANEGSLELKRKMRKGSN